MIVMRTVHLRLYNDCVWRAAALVRIALRHDLILKVACIPPSKVSHLMSVSSYPEGKTQMLSANVRLISQLVALFGEAIPDEHNGLGDDGMSGLFESRGKCGKDACGGFSQG